MSGITIEEAVQKLDFREEIGNERYSDTLVCEVEELVGCALPEDLRWYLLNCGSRELAEDCGHAMYQKEDAQFVLEFTSVESAVFIKNRYDDHVEASKGRQFVLPLDKFVPIATIEGNGAPFRYRVLANLSPDEFGSIWTDKIVNRYDDEESSDPVRICDSFADFLCRFGDRGALQDSANSHNRAILDGYLADYIPLGHAAPNTGETPTSIIRQLLKDADQFVYDGAQNVVHRVYKGAYPIASFEEFVEKAGFYAYRTRPVHGRASGFIRQDTRFSDPIPSQPATSLSGISDRFWDMTATSKLLNGLEIRETFLLCQIDGIWSILERLSSVIDPVKIKKLGTFVFDELGYWRTVRKLKPAFLELPAEILVDGLEDSLDEAKIDTIRNVIEDAALRGPIETALRGLKDGSWGDHHDTTLLENERDVWQLVKRTGHHVHFQEDAVHVNLATRLDDEHHVSMVLKDGTLKLKDY